MRAEVQKAIDEVNAHVGPVEQIKRFEILPHDLSQETGELTPTLKVKRNVVHEKYADLVDRIYDSTPLTSQGGVASNDPTDTGGLFIGRRPGTGPVRYRDVKPDSERRRRADRLLADALLALEIVLCLIAVRPAAGRLALGRLAGPLPDRLRDRRHHHHDARLPGVADAHDGGRQARRPRLEARAPRGGPPSRSAAPSSASSR